jgi:DNA gyrase subunit A
MRLARLTGLEREKLAKEYGELCDRIARLEAILASEALLLDVIVDELKEVREKYGDERRTEIVAAEGDIAIEDLIANEAMAVTVTHSGYLKRVPLSEYRAQSRGGKGTRAAELREEDFVVSLFVANTHSDLFFLTDKGRVYGKKVYEIPVGSRQARGRHVNNLLAIEAGGEKIAAIVPIEKFDEEHYLLTCTRGGTVKRTALSAYANMRQTGIIAVQIEEGDQLLGARIVSEDSEILIGTAHGMSIRFAASAVRPMGRDTRGVRGIDLREGDRVIGMDVIDDEAKQVLAISANGYGKRTPLKDAEGNPNWRVQNRGGLGIIAMETSERNGELVALRVVRVEDQIMVITNGGQIIRTHVSQIREAGRNTQGVRIIRVVENERVVDVEPVAEPEEGDLPPLPEVPDSILPPGGGTPEA